MRRNVAKAVRRGDVKLVSYRGTAVPMAAPEPLATDLTIREHFQGISAATLRRWRADRGFPAPEFYVDRRGFTQWSKIEAWKKTQSATSPIAGRQVGDIAAHAS